MKKFLCVQKKFQIKEKKKIHKCVKYKTFIKTMGLNQKGKVLQNLKYKNCIVTMGFLNFIESFKLQIITLIYILSFTIYIYSPHDTKFTIMSALEYFTQKKVYEINYYEYPLSNIYNSDTNKLDFTNLAILSKEPLIYTGKFNIEKCIYVLSKAFILLFKYLYLMTSTTYQIL